MKQLPVQKGINARGRRSDGQGFTIVELLIVVVVIAILAAIVIVAFNGVQKRAQTSAASSAVTQAQRKLNLYQVDNGTYPTQLSAAGVTDNKETTFQYAGGGTSYCVTATVGSTSVFASETNTTPTVGGCPGHGQGGVAAVTNLATNPSAESGSGWLSNNGAVYPRLFDTARSRSGARSVSASNLSASTALLSLYDVGGAPMPVSASTAYTSAVYFTADVAHSARLSCSFRVAGAYGTTVYGGSVIGVPGSWTRISQTCTSPAGADMLRIAAFVDASATQPAGTKAYVDDFITVAGNTSPNYADGSSANWVWNGTPNASTSTGPPL